MKPFGHPFRVVALRALAEVDLAIPEAVELLIRRVADARIKPQALPPENHHPEYPLELRVPGVLRLRRQPM